MTVPANLLLGNVKDVQTLSLDVFEYISYILKFHQKLVI